jgi:hypothetical protein
VKTAVLFLALTLSGANPFNLYGKPVLILDGPNPLTNYVGEPFIDPGARLTAPPNAIAAGFNFSAAIKADGTVVAWGYNARGEVDVPPNLRNVEALATSADSENCLALKANGTVIQWGFNISPVPNGLKNVKALAAANFHNLALRANGTVIAWGTDYYGGNAAADVPTGLRSVRDIVAGNYYSIALKENGDLIGWGEDPTVLGNMPQHLDNIQNLAGGWAFVYALKSDGTVLAWGNDFFGQTDVPDGLTDVVQVAMGYGFGLALKADGTVVKWGWDGYIPDVSVPPDLDHVVAIATGDYHCLALQENGTIVGWGDNTYGQLDIPASVTNLDVKIPVKGTVHTNIPGTYTLHYYAKGPSGRVFNATRRVVILPKKNRQ